MDKYALRVCLSHMLSVGGQTGMQHCAFYCRHYVTRLVDWLERCIIAGTDRTNTLWSSLIVIIVFEWVVICVR